jgi:hypothetical protein
MSPAPDYFAPIADQMRTEHLFVVFGFLWPFVLAISATAFKWRHLSSRTALFVLGVLVSFGAHVLLSELAGYIFWLHFARTPLMIPALRFIDPKFIVMIAAVISIPLVLWLAALLNSPLSPNHRAKQP